MPNLSSVFNEQIKRLARREIRRNNATVRKLVSQHRRDIAALKRQMTATLRSLAFLERTEKRRVTANVPPPQAAEGLRFRADGLKTHRAKLGISAADYGRLAGVSGLTIYHWESGKARPRQAQLAKVATVRGIGKREALRRLAMLGGKPKDGEKAKAKRGSYAQTAEELVLSLAKKAMSGADINAAWKKAGRPGRADNAIGRLVKSGQLKRQKAEGVRGSQYIVK